MDEAAAHLVDHVVVPLPLRQWVLCVPKRLRRQRVLLFPTETLPASPVQSGLGLKSRKWDSSFAVSASLQSFGRVTSIQASM